MSAPPPGPRRPRVGIARQLPEPARFWIAHASRHWGAAAAPWTDLAGARLRDLEVGPAATLPDLDATGVDATGLDDLFYLPPVAPELAVDRDRWAARLIESGTPVLLQLAPGDEADVPGALIVHDLLRPLLAADVEPLARLAAGSTAVWPLIAGLTDSAELREAGCAALAAAGVACVQPLALELAPADRRRLAELTGGEAFDALFHGAAPSERELSCYAASRGLAAFVPRPLLGGTPRQQRNRRLAAGLALAGELWARLDRPVSVGQGLLLAARGAENTSRDLVALAREGNLGVLDWIDDKSLEIAWEIEASGSSATVEALLEEYLGSGA
ncbi:MAG: hypothetical protein GY719_17310 [bacterium]|nr:hypothetical protein [bacterium]